MIRGLSGRVVLLVLAVAFVAGLVISSRQPPPIDDEVGDAQKDLAANLGFDVDRAVGDTGGLVVLKVTPGTPADKLGIRAGDSVLAVNERSVWHAKQLMDVLYERLNRGPVRLMLKNKDAYRTVVLGAGGGRGPAGGPPGTMPGRSPSGAPAGKMPGRAPAPTPAGAARGG